ncbi:MAG: hypothetical protein WCA20_11115 [Candidatus Sulfotelmatobacter sp.]
MTNTSHSVGITGAIVPSSRARLWADARRRGTGPRLQLVVSKETLRQWLIAAKLWRARRARVEREHVWRARRARYGELVQWDTSEHDWLEGPGEKLHLIAMIDDAASRLTARFAGHDSTEENLRQLGCYEAARATGIGLHR